MANDLNEAAQIPEIWETEEERKLEIKQLKSKYTRYAYKNFIKETPLVLLNQPTKHIITEQPVSKFKKTVIMGIPRTCPGVLKIRVNPSNFALKALS